MSRLKVAVSSAQADSTHLAVKLGIPAGDLLPVVLTPNQRQRVFTSEFSPVLIRYRVAQCRRQRFEVVDVAEPAIRARSGIDHEAQGAPASGGDHRNSCRHGLEVHLAERLVVRRCNEDIGEVESLGKNIVRQPSAEKHVGQFEGTGDRVWVLAFPLTGHPAPDQEIEGGGIIPVVEGPIDSRDGPEQQGNALEVEKAPP